MSNFSPSLSQQTDRSISLASCSTTLLLRYGGPCLPGRTHHYHFTLYALDTMLDITAKSDKKIVIAAMHGHILEQTTLIWTYQRKK